MGTVVDVSLKVKGTKNLRVVDASVVSYSEVVCVRVTHNLQIPLPIAAHYQVAVYAIAEQAADIIVNESFNVGGTDLK